MINFTLRIQSSLSLSRRAAAAPAATRGQCEICRNILAIARALLLCTTCRHANMQRAWIPAHWQSNLNTVIAAYAICIIMMFHKRIHTRSHMSPIIQRPGRITNRSRMQMGQPGPVYAAPTTARRQNGRQSERTEPSQSAPPEWMFNGS